MVAKSSLANRRFSVHHFDTGCGIDPCFPNEKFAMNYYGIVKDDESDQRIITFSAPENGVYDAGEYMKRVDGKLKTIERKYGTTKETARILFIGFSAGGRAKLSGLSGRLAAMNCQVFIYTGSRPSSTLELGMLFMNLAGCFDTDKLNVVQPGFARTGKIETSKAIYPDSERIIHFGGSYLLPTHSKRC